uniref:Uncharacterized protein n=1 Tax=Arundo donax TaxID=35708 RepID=A0A0A9A7W2_ARUDO
MIRIPLPIYKIFSPLAAFTSLSA